MSVAAGFGRADAQFLGCGGKGFNALGYRLQDGAHGGHTGIQGAGKPADLIVAHNLYRHRQVFFRHFFQGRGCGKDGRDNQTRQEQADTEAENRYQPHDPRYQPPE